MTVHIFVSHHADLLPRWQAAFPEASALHTKHADSVQATHLWLRLQAEGEVPVQLANAHRLSPEASVLVLSDIPNDDEGLSAFAEGARAYCNTHATPETLQQVADVVAQGGLWIGESLMRRLLTATSTMARSANVPRQDWAAVLTPRELEVARAVANGASNKEIARQLDITERTVKAHVGAILEKLQVRDRLQISLKINGL